MRLRAIPLIFLTSAFALTPVLAEARGWGFGAGLCLGFPLGCLFGSSRPAAAPPPPPPATCYRTVPEHWEARWDPYAQSYVNVYFPPSTVPAPCP